MMSELDDELEHEARLIVSRTGSSDPEDDPRTTAIVYAILLGAQRIATALGPKATIVIDPMDGLDG